MFNFFSGLFSLFPGNDGFPWWGVPLFTVFLFWLGWSSGDFGWGCLLGAFGFLVSTVWYWLDRDL